MVTDPSEAERTSPATLPESESAAAIQKRQEGGDALTDGVDKYRVDSLDPEDDPKQYTTTRKWIAVGVIAGGSVCATCASSIVSAHITCQTASTYAASLRPHSRKQAWNSRCTPHMRLAS
jgi:hypothetical protein